MPNLDGPGAAKELRSLGYNGFIIGITGWTSDEDIENFLSHGVNEVLIKPVKIYDIDKAIGIKK
jgi:CheY-like chemotaxis protein